MPNLSSRSISTSEKKLYIVILNWNLWSDTLECLESVFHSHYSNMRVIVCDNDSQDGSLDYIKSWAEGKIDVWIPSNHALRYLSFPPCPKPITYVELKASEISSKSSSPEVPPLTLIQTESNLGFAGGNNVGLHYITSQKNAEYIWILNNDTVVDPNAIPYMIQLSQTNIRIGLIGGQLLYYDRPEMIQGIAGKMWPYLGKEAHIGEHSTNITAFSSHEPIDHVIGASIFLKHKTMLDIGQMDESYFMYSEDKDWCLRAQKRGWENYYCATAKIWHKESISFGKKNLQRDYYLVRNKLYLTYKFYPFSFPTALLCIIYQTILPKLVRLQFKRLKVVLKAFLDFFMGKRGPYQI